MDKEKIADFILKELKFQKENSLIDENTVLDENSRLIGSERIIKSRTFVELMLAIEEFVEDEYDLEFDWSNDRAMSGKRSPFLTVGTLVDFIINTAK